MTNENKDRLDEIISKPRDYAIHNDRAWVTMERSEVFDIIQGIERLRLINEGLVNVQQATMVCGNCESLQSKLEEANHILMDIPANSNPDLMIRELKEKLATVEKERDELRASCKRKDENVDYQIIEKEKLKKENASLRTNEKWQDNQAQQMIQDQTGTILRLNKEIAKLTTELESK